KGKLLSLSTDADRTLFFDFMPIQLGKIKDFNIRFQLYTVPGQVRYNATRKLVLKGADAVVFVADSQSVMKEQNLESFQNMKDNLSANNIDPEDIPVILQYNKRDLKKIMSVDEMNVDLNPKNDDITEASAYEGWGVDETFKLVTRRLLKFISKKHNVKIDQDDEEEATVAAAPTPVAEAPLVDEEPMFDPDPEPVSASKSDQINISVKDKAADLLGDDSFLDESISSEWDDVLTEDDSEGSLEVDVPETSEFIDNDEIDALLEKENASPEEDDSLLEQMLDDDSSVAHESSIEDLALPPETPAFSDTTDDSTLATLTEMVSTLLDEIKETKSMQQEMLNALKKMDKSLLPIYNLASKKKAPR
ncbi:ADP-ribosylation factor-like protein, partial [Nitrospirota bacterium]